MIFTYKPVRSNVIVVTDMRQLEYWIAYELVETIRGHEDVKYIRRSNINDNEIRFLYMNNPHCHYKDCRGSNWRLQLLKYVQSRTPSGQLLVYRR